MAPENGAKTDRLHLRLPPEVMDRFEEVAEHDGLSVSAVVRPAVMDRYRELGDHRAVLRKQNVSSVRTEVDP